MGEEDPLPSLTMENNEVASEAAGDTQQPEKQSSSADEKVTIVDEEPKITAEKVAIEAKGVSDADADTDANSDVDADPDEDETASASSGDEFEDSSSEDEGPPMPIMKYSRISGLPRAASKNDGGIGPLSKPCTCSAMARVLLDPLNEASENQNATTPASSLQEDPQRMLRSDLWSQQPLFILAAGFQTGRVSLLSVANGRPVVSQPQLVVREGTWNAPPSVVAVSFDSSGTVLAAMDKGGTCAVWEFKYYPTWSKSTRSSSIPSGPTVATSTNTSDASAAAASGNDNMFSSFMSALTGMPPPPSESSANRNSNNNTGDSTIGVNNDNSETRPVLCLAASILQLSRVTYPSNWKSPTCMALDPAYKRKREKSFCVGFSDGRLLLTKRGGLFQRRNDTVLFQGSDNTRGIECITWRANLVAWADASGIKLMDIETLTRIAHIERPTGARPTLYPTISSLKPHLYFETSKTLLAGWGDCLMNLQIKDIPPANPEEKPKRSVEITMAWELEGIACGVAPMDANHVAVLALVTPRENDEEEDAGNVSGSGQNDLEVQILSRKDGNILYCDSLPLVKPVDDNAASKLVAESAAQYMMLSTFALPRMDHASELEEFNTWTQNNPSSAASNALEDFDMTVNTLFSAGSRGSNKETFVDSHLKWNIQSILFDEDESPEDDEFENEDTDSVDSDDYQFALRPIVDKSAMEPGPLPPPPMMVILSSSDVVLVRMSDVDDAVGHALNQQKPATALSRGLRHRRQLRRYQLSDLADNYLNAILKVSPPARQLSLRRMKLAVRSMPVLLGGQIEMWEKWSKELERIPGSLFLLRKQLPVRDPVLPSHVYERILHGMFSEVDKLPQITPAEDSSELYLGAAQHFLESVLAWGPTSILKECIKLHKYSREKYINDENCSTIKPVEVALQRRYLQTAAGYLNFPVDMNEESALESTAPRYEADKDDTQDSLFRVEKVLEWMIPYTPSAALPKELENVKTVDTVDNQISLDAVARLRMMQNRYDLALKAFLMIGDLHSPLTIQQLEADALEVVNSNTDPNIEPIVLGSSSYEFVLGIIEFHHLHQYLLDETFLSKQSNDSTQTPIFALLRMVGLPLMGNFLIEHCVSPEFSSSDSQFGREPVRKETLPLDDVAKQLEKSPALLHWYLHLVITKKPELYVKFPNNAIPPKSVTELHRKHFKLHLKFAGDDSRDSAKSLAGTEAYKVEAKTTPLLSFLKATLPLGGVLPVDARRELEILRSEGSGSDDDEEDAGEENGQKYKSNSFSLELAYIIENYSEQTEEEALGVLDLYLEGANSLMLAVSYAQRNRQLSSILWNKLISYCLSKGAKASENEGDGMLFGALLEAAALSGADLARLVARIPPGMVVEGLRPRLVAAVADYRFKLDMHQAAATAAANERVALLREEAHRSRRGVRYSVPNQPKISQPKKSEESKMEEMEMEEVSFLPKSLRTMERRGHHRLAFSIPMR